MKQSAFGLEEKQQDERPARAHGRTDGGRKRDASAWPDTDARATMTTSDRADRIIIRGTMTLHPTYTYVEQIPRNALQVIGDVQRVTK